MAIIESYIEDLKGETEMASKLNLDELKSKAINAENAHEAYEFAQAYEHIFKAETERIKAEWDAAYNEERNRIEQAKADVDAVIRHEQSECEAERIAIEKVRLEDERDFNQQKLKNDRENIYLKAGAVIGGAAIFTLAEKYGALVSKYAAQLFKLV